MATEVLRATDIRNRTLKLSMDPHGKPYNRLDIGNALSEIMDTKDIHCLGPLNRNVEWYLTVSTDTVKNFLLQSNGIIVFNKFWGHFSPASTTEVKARIHWLPPWVENYKISQAFEREGLEVKHISVDKSTVKLSNGKTLENSYITARTVILKTKPKQSVPYLLQIQDLNFNESYQALVTIPGRKGLCLRCKTPGHYSATCTTPYCTKCSSYGHKPIDCRRLYSGAVRRGTQDEEVSDMDEGAVEAAEAPSPSRSLDHMMGPLSTQAPIPSTPSQTTTQGVNTPSAAAPVLGPAGGSAQGDTAHTEAAPQLTPLPPRLASAPSEAERPSNTGGGRRALPLPSLEKSASEAERLSSAAAGHSPAGHGRDPTAGGPPPPPESADPSLSPGRGGSRSDTPADGEVPMAAGFALPSTPSARPKTCPPNTTPTSSLATTVASMPSVEAEPMSSSDVLSEGESYHSAAWGDMSGEDLFSQNETKFEIVTQRPKRKGKRNIRGQPPNKGKKTA